MTNKELIEKIKREVLGIPTYGFEDTELWKEFEDNYFSRSGVIDGESYSAKLNGHLSGAALSHTLTEIRKRLDALNIED
jgi:hypothetical protein